MRQAATATMEDLFGADEDEGMTVSRDVQIVASNDRIMAEV